MKTKPIILATAISLLFAVSTLLTRCKTSLRTDSTEVSQFLYKFDNSVTEGNVDTLMACFQDDKKTATLKQLVDLLAGKKSLTGGKPLSSIKLDIPGTDIKNITNDLISAAIPVTLSQANSNSSKSILILKIRKVGPNQMKIIQADARKFLTDYLAYENYVRKQNSQLDTTIYSPITLAAFKTATGLKTKYDSVIWFAHLNNKTFFYVVKGTWNSYRDILRQKDSVVDNFKMGLLSPELKEIIPVEYDLIHNINGTFKGLVEVEKNNKKGFYNLRGKLILPVDYDQIFPIDDKDNLAVLRNGKDYFYLKKDTTVSEKVDLKLIDFVTRITNLSHNFDIYKNALSVVTEYNSRVNNDAIYIAPSYLVELNFISKSKDFANPLRKTNYVEDIHKQYQVAINGSDNKNDNWFLATFYSIRDYFLGGRSEFYDKKNLVIVDKKHDRVFTQDISIDQNREESWESSSQTCDFSSVKAINDSLFEVKSGAAFTASLYDSTKDITSGTYYTYLSVKGDHLVELKNNRYFGFTKYIKMDDSYLNGCYTMLVGSGSYDNRITKKLDHITPEMLLYIKNEIYADYRYAFKDKRWQVVFEDMNALDVGGREKQLNKSVEDSLSATDKYNIAWIDQKLKEIKAVIPKTNRLASR